MYAKLAALALVASTSAYVAHITTQAFADARYNDLVAQVEISRAASIERARAREQEWQSKINEIQKDYEKKQKDHAANIAAADAVNNRLQEELNKRRAAADVSSSATCGCESATASADLHTELLGRANDAAGELARFADATALALGACVEAYNSLRE